LAVKIRLRRMGKKKHPFYRIIAADSRAARNGRFIELVGTYDPVATPHIVNYKEDRVLYWLSVGAQPTDTVKSLFRGKGLWLKWTLMKQGADEAKIASELANWENSQEEKAKRVEAEKVQAAQQVQKAKDVAAKETKEADEKEQAAQQAQKAQDVAAKETKEADEKDQAEVTAVEDKAKDEASDE